MLRGDDVITISCLNITKNLLREIPREIKNKSLRDQFKKGATEGIGNWREYINFKDGEFKDEIYPEPLKGSSIYLDYLERTFRGAKVPDLELTVFTFDVECFQFILFKIDSNTTRTNYKTDFAIHFPYEYKEVMDYISPDYLTRIVKKHAPQLSTW